MSVVQGLVTGLVTAVDDKEGEGRIKVSYRWLDDEHQTDWVRIAAPMAGPGRGAFFMPEVEDEVLLGFEHGDVRHPYVLGFLWNGVDAPPADHVRLRRFRSVNGHQISFIDSTPAGGSKGALVVEDAHGNVVTLSNGKVVVKSVGVLQLEAPTIILQGPGGGWRRVVTPNSNPI